MNHTPHHRIDALASKVNALEDRLSRLETSFIPEGEPTPDDPSDIAHAKLWNLCERLQDIRADLIDLLDIHLGGADIQEKVWQEVRTLRHSAFALYHLLNDHRCP